MSREENNVLTRDVLVKFHPPSLKNWFYLCLKTTVAKRDIYTYLLKTSDRYGNIDRLSRFIPLS